MHAEAIARMARTSDVLDVFYDRDEQAQLWGKNLYEYLSELYSSRSDYVLMFISKAYAERAWTTLERRSAQERAFKENREYILPVRLDDTNIPGVLDTTGYLDLREISIEQVFDCLVSKITSSPRPFDLERIASPATPPVIKHIAELDKRNEILKDWVGGIATAILILVSLFTVPSEDAHRSFAAKADNDIFVYKFYDWGVCSYSTGVSESIETFGIFGKVFNFKRLFNDE